MASVDLFPFSSSANYRHLMLYGPPGTGKTMFARRLAQQVRPGRGTSSPVRSRVCRHASAFFLTPPPLHVTFRAASTMPSLLAATLDRWARTL